MKGPVKVKFIPIKDGDVIEEVDGGRGTALHFIGFKPGRAGKREGWLVYLLHTSPATRTDTWNTQPEIVKVPSTTGVYKRRSA